MLRVTTVWICLLKITTWPCFSKRPVWEKISCHKISWWGQILQLGEEIGAFCPFFSPITNFFFRQEHFNSTPIFSPDQNERKALFNLRDKCVWGKSSILRKELKTFLHFVSSCSFCNSLGEYFWETNVEQEISTGWIKIGVTNQRGNDRASCMILVPKSLGEHAKSKHWARFPTEKFLASESLWWKIRGVDQSQSLFYNICNRNNLSVVVSLAEGWTLTRGEASACCMCGPILTSESVSTQVSTPFFVSASNLFVSLVFWKKNRESCCLCQNDQYCDTNYYNLAHYKRAPTVLSGAWGESLSVSSKHCRTATKASMAFNSFMITCFLSTKSQFLGIRCTQKPKCPSAVSQVWELIRSEEAGALWQTVGNTKKGQFLSFQERLALSQPCKQARLESQTGRVSNQSSISARCDAGKEGCSGMKNVFERKETDVHVLSVLFALACTFRWEVKFNNVVMNLFIMFVINNQNPEQGIALWTNTARIRMCAH